MEVQPMGSNPVQRGGQLNTEQGAKVQLQTKGSAEAKKVETEFSLEDTDREWLQEDLHRGIEAMNDLSVFRERSLAFEQHETLNRTIVKIIDRETEEIVREIPPEKFLDMISSMLEFAGIIIDEKV